MFKSIVCTYPDFRELPKGLKQMLVASESLFFGEVKTSAARTGGEAAERKYWLPPLQRHFFTRRRESQHAQSRAFQRD